MKRVILFVAITTTLAATIISCGKSTRGKMDGEWKLDSLKSSSTSVSGSSNSSATISIDGTVYSTSNTNSSGTTTQTGTVKAATWNIKKDGTWERELAFSYVDSGTTTTVSTKSSGSWGFEGKGTDFKRNERVVFSTLSESTVQVSTVGSVSTTESSNSTYLDGENVEIFVITESKRKSLSMEVKKSNNTTATDGTVSIVSAEAAFKMSLQ